MRRVALWCITAMFTLVTGACSGGESNRSSSAAPSDAAPTAVVTMGGRTTEGENVPDRLHNAWPYRMFATALPRSTVFVNAAVPGKAADAPRTQLPIVRELKPDIVVMWIGAEDLRAGTPIATFAQQLSRTVTAVQALGVQRVLVGNLPAAYGGRVMSYNNAIQHVVRETGAELVELEHERITITRAGRTGASELDVAGHHVVAEAFGRRIAQR
jgi:GDSL-like Lipase/Acylhydrolase family